MLQKNRVLILVLMECIISFCKINADIGSDSAVSRQAQIVLTGTFNNTVLGFAALAGGFFLTDTATSFSFNSYFPVGVTAGLNGGTCYLMRDMPFDSYVTIETSGTIEGNFHTLEFAPRSELLKFPAAGQFKRLDQQSTANVAYAVDWFVTDTYLLVGTSAQLQVYVWNDTTTSLTYTNQLALSSYANEVRWQSTFTNIPYYCALAAGDGLYTYSFNPNTGSISQVNSTAVGSDISSVDWASSGTYLAMSYYGGGVGSTSVSVYSVSNGLMALVTTTNSLPLRRQAYYSALAWNKGGNYLAVGTNLNGGSIPPNNTLFLFTYNGANLSLVQSVRLPPTSSAVYGSGVYTLGWSHDGTLLAVGLGGTTSETLRNKIRIFRFDATAAPNYLTEITSYRNGETQDVYNISWDADDSNLAYVRQTGSSFELRACVVDRVVQQLSLWAQGVIGSLGWSVSWNKIEELEEHERVYIAVAGANSTATVWGVASQPFIFKDIDIVFNGPVQLKESIIFNGQCSVTTNHNFLNVNGNNIYMAPNSGLTVYNSTLYGLGGDSRVVFFDNTPTITLVQTQIINTSDFYMNGPLSVEGDVLITGSYKFTYSTDRVSWIKAYSTLYFDSGVTFSYDPPGGASNLIQFESMDSKLFLNEASTYINSLNGLSLTKGQLTINGFCPLIALHGLYLGDGTAANNITMNVLSDSGIKINGGYLINRLTY